MPNPILRLVSLAIVLGIAAPLSAQQATTKADGDTGRTPLNLSQPREVATPSGATSDRMRFGPDGATDARYGMGFEARRHGHGGRSFGGSGAGTAGGGRGMGRGR